MANHLVIDSPWPEGFTRGLPLNCVIEAATSSWNIYVDSPTAARTVVQVNPQPAGSEARLSAEQALVVSGRMAIRRASGLIEHATRSATPGEHLQFVHLTRATVAVPGGGSDIVIRVALVASGNRSVYALNGALAYPAWTPGNAMTLPPARVPEIMMLAWGQASGIPRVVHILAPTPGTRFGDVWHQLRIPLHVAARDAYPWASDDPSTGEQITALRDALARRS